MRSAFYTHCRPRTLDLSLCYHQNRFDFNSISFIHFAIWTNMNSSSFIMFSCILFLRIETLCLHLTDVGVYDKTRSTTSQRTGNFLLSTTLNASLRVKKPWLIFVHQVLSKRLFPQCYLLFDDFLQNASDFMELFLVPWVGLSCFDECFWEVEKIYLHCKRTLHHRSLVEFWQQSGCGLVGVSFCQGSVN